MNIGRTRFKKDIVAEYIPPARALKNDRVVIFASGMPSVPKKDDLLHFWSQKGYWAIFPRYRGTWESDGEFLKDTPTRDILDVIDHISNKPFRDIFSETDIQIEPSEIHVIGSSFSGPAVLFASADERVTSSTALSPVIDWRAEVHNESTPLDWLGGVVKEAFGNGYRFSMKNWNKLKTGKFHNPAIAPEQISAEKCYIIHAENDGAVTLQPIKDFREETGIKTTLLKHGGHFGVFDSTKPQMYERIKKHIQRQ